MSIKRVKAPLLPNIPGNSEPSFVPRRPLAGTGIPEEFRRILEECGGIRVKCKNLQETCKIPVNMAKNRNFLPLPKGGSCDKIPQRILRNPEESWQD
jgi:hypothetical protein